MEYDKLAVSRWIQLAPATWLMPRMHTDSTTLPRRTFWKWNSIWLLNSLAQNSFPFLVICRLLATGIVSNTFQIDTHRDEMAMARQALHNTSLTKTQLVVGAIKTLDRGSITHEVRSDKPLKRDREI